MNEFSRRLILRYDPGQFTFRHFDVMASDEGLYNLAMQLNSVQEDEVDKILKIQVFQLR